MSNGWDIETWREGNSPCTCPARHWARSFIYILPIHHFLSSLQQYCKVGLFPPRLQNPESLGCNSCKQWKQCLLMEAKRNFSGKNGMVYRIEGKTGEPGFSEDGEQRWPPSIVIRGGENRLPSSWTVFMMGDGVAWRKWTHHYQTNRQWVLDKHKQDQTLTGHGSNLLLCRGSESSGVDTWQQTQASWLQIWCEHQVSSGFGIKIFFFFFSNKPSRKNSYSYCTWRSYHHCRLSLIPGLKTHPHEGFQKLLSLQLWWPPDLQWEGVLPTSGSDCHNSFIFMSVMKPSRGGIIHRYKPASPLLAGFKKWN